jgi:Dyp-type peroxidase family
MSRWLRADRIQGNVYPGFNKDEQVFLWIRFPTPEAARAWLKETGPELTSALEVIAFRDLLAHPEVQPEPRSTWVNLAFSRQGLECLMAPTSSGAFPEPFEKGMAARAADLGDDPATWRFGNTPETEAHALLVIGADLEADLLQALGVHRARLARHGARDLFLDVLGTDCRGANLPDPLKGHEHFGYRDGISKPRLDGSAGTGDFVLGYPDAAGQESASGPAWTRNGSYLVFRRLHQDVAGFHRALEAVAQRAGLESGAQLGAKLFGRWPSGAKLLDPKDRDPGVTAPAEYTADEFGADPNGELVPCFAHVRKAHPRDPAAGGLTHRLLRRGIPYGPPLASAGSDGVPQDDGRERGLLFAAYQADLGRQYELVQRWLNDRNFPAPQTGQDVIAGQGEEPARVVLRSPDALPAMFDLHHHVSMTGGGYFFAPSLSAVRFLADPTTTWEQQEASMGDVMSQELGALIASENPYGAMTEVDFTAVTRSGIGKTRNAALPFPQGNRTRTPNEPEYWQGFFWPVDATNGATQSVRISKVLRIPYTVAGTKYTLVVGFEGAGGP